MSNQQTKDQYSVTSTFFKAYGGQIDGEAGKYINDYARDNNMRLINVVVKDNAFVFFWAAK